MLFNLNRFHRRSICGNCGWADGIWNSDTGGDNPGTRCWAEPQSPQAVEPKEGRGGPWQVSWKAGKKKLQSSPKEPAVSSLPPAPRKVLPFRPQVWDAQAPLGRVWSLGVDYDQSGCLWQSDLWHSRFRVLCNLLFLSFFFFFGWKTFKYVLLFIICATFLEHCLPVSSLGQLPYSFIHWCKILRICSCKAHALDFN